MSMIGEKTHLFDLCFEWELFVSNLVFWLWWGHVYFPHQLLGLEQSKHFLSLMRVVNAQFGHLYLHHKQD